MTPTEAHIKTLISPVCARFPTLDPNMIGSTDNVVGYAVGDGSAEEGGDKGIYWLDRMLDGGLQLPEAKAGVPPFLLLLTGPPGTGKSLFAQQLLHNLAGELDRSDRGNGKERKRPASLYVSAEWPVDRVLNNAKKFGWQQDNLFIPGPPPGDPSAWCSRFAQQDNPIVVLGPQRGFASDANTTGKILKTLVERGVAMLPQANWHTVVIDSLNSLNPADQQNEGGVARLLQGILECFTNLNPGLRLLILMLDSSPDTSPSNYWEFLADAVFRFEGAIGADGYYLRSFQIVKIKNQSHAWGKHTLKIYGGGDEKASTLIAAGGAPRNFLRTEDAPYIETGGVFIFPSIHWHLSLSIREEPKLLKSWSRNNGRFYPTPLSELNSIFANEKNSETRGLPTNHTTLLIGRRGAMKSHLAYYTLLSHLLGILGDKKEDEKEEPKYGLLISLRNDPEAALHTMASILEQQKLIDSGTGADTMKKLVAHDRLEILYNWPGYITPDEFFHRIFVALARERKSPATSRELRIKVGGEDKEIPRPAQDRPSAEIVVVEGLDHLNSRFPLCAKEKVFIPALVSLFRAYKMCSLVVSSEESDLERGPNVRALCDLILDFSEPSESDYTDCRLPKWRDQAAKVCATRVPAGQIGGRWGILGRKSSGEVYFVDPKHPLIDGQ